MTPKAFGSTMAGQMNRANTASTHTAWTSSLLKSPDDINRLKRASIEITITVSEEDPFKEVILKQGFGQ